MDFEYESETIDKYLKELKNLRNKKVTEIPILVGAFGTVPRYLENKMEELEIRGRIVTTA